MFVEEQVFRDQVTSELVDRHGLIKPLASLILDLALPTWTWNLEKLGAWDIAVPNATRNTITLRSPPNPYQSFAHEQWVDLCSSEPLRVGDCMMFVLNNIPQKSLDRLLIIVKGEPHNDTIGGEPHNDTIYLKFDSGCIDHIGITTGIREGRYQGYGRVIAKTLSDQLTQVSRIVLSRDEHKVQMLLTQSSENSELQHEFELSVVKADQIVFPAVAVHVCEKFGSKMTDCTITLANAIKK